MIMRMRIKVYICTSYRKGQNSFWWFYQIFFYQINNNNIFPLQTLCGSTVVPSTDKLPALQAGVWSLWCVSARRLVWEWVRVKPACTSCSLHAFLFLQRALDSTPLPGPNPLISMPGEHRGAGQDRRRTGAWGDAWLQPLSQIVSATCPDAVRLQLIVDQGVEV